MKIADYSLATQSSHAWSQQLSIKESVRAWIDRPPPPPASSVNISPAAQEKQASEAAAMDKASSGVQTDPNLSVLITMIEKLTGHKVRIFDASQLHASQSADSSSSAESTQAQRTRSGAEYSKVVSYSESEQTTFQASGVIKTSDGREIKFDLNLVMQRQYSETISTSVRVGDAPRKTDPLIINFNGTAAQLSEQRFAFDLNSDGQKEQINAPMSGSGFLALDLNNNGKIDNGKELFGPSSGNGFGELAQYDSDHNGWIDENDPVFQQLKVWTKDSAGKDLLRSLASAGVGALSLQATATPFDIKNSINQLLGTVQSSSVALNENGTVGSLQQVDLTA